MGSYGTGVQWKKCFIVHTHHQSCMVHWWVLVQSGQQRATSTSLGKKKKTCLNFLALPTKGKDIVFRFIIEYSSLRNFGPKVIIICLFLYEDFWKMIFLFVLKLEISYRVIISGRILVFLLEDFLKIIFLHGEIFEFPSFFFCLKVLLNVNGKATVWHTPCFSVIGEHATQEYFFPLLFWGAFCKNGILILVSIFQMPLL